MDVKNQKKKPNIQTQKQRLVAMRALEDEKQEATHISKEQEEWMKLSS